jgi:hypothetical protein
MADIKTAYGTGKQSLTITLNSLASSVTDGRQSTPVDNGTNKFLDALVQVKLTLPSTGSPANDKRVYVYAYGTTDPSGDSHPKEITAAGAQATIGTADAAYVLNSAGTPLRLIGSIAVPNIVSGSNGIIISNPMSVAAAFGGRLPQEWGIAVRNYCGLTLHSSGCEAWYQGVYATA